MKAAVSNVFLMNGYKAPTGELFVPPSAGGGVRNDISAALIASLSPVVLKLHCGEGLTCSQIHSRLLPAEANRHSETVAIIYVQLWSCPNNNGVKENGGTTQNECRLWWVMDTNTNHGAMLPWSHGETVLCFAECLRLFLPNTVCQM